MFSKSCAGRKISSKLINVQTKIRPCRWEFLFKINKSACTSIRYTREYRGGPMPILQFTLEIVPTLCTTLQMFVGIYKDFAGKSECGDFKFTGIACIPAIPVIFEVNQKKKCGLFIYTLY